MRLEFAYANLPITRGLTKVAGRGLTNERVAINPRAEARILYTEYDSRMRAVGLPC